MSDLKRQLIGAIIVILTVAAVIAAGINFQQQSKFRLPDDGVVWVDRLTEPKDGLPGRIEVVANHVVPDSPADHAGIHQGDVLVRIGTLPVEQATDVARILAGLGVWSKPDYTLLRIASLRGANLPLPITTKLVVAERELTVPIKYQYVVGVAYLFIGLFVFFRRGTAHRAIHFYLLCLSSFVLYTFHYTGKLNNFDKAVYLSNVIAGLFLPALFVHFTLVFPVNTRLFQTRWRRVALYVIPLLASVAWILVISGVLRLPISSIELRWWMDRLWMGFLAAGQLLGAIILSLRFKNVKDPIERNQLKWLRNGTWVGILPFLLTYVVPYVLGRVPTKDMEMSIFFLILVPLTWAYAIARYRLMDVDLIFQQGYIYTLATLATIGVFYGLLLAFAPQRTNSTGEPISLFEDLPPAAFISLVLVAAFVFQPIRNWLQEVLDKHFFYRDRFDYRRTLIEFARELSGETDLNHMLGSVSDRLLHTISINHLAFFLLEEKTTEQDNPAPTHQPGKFRLYLTGGMHRPIPATMDLSFLSAESAATKSHLFFERTRGILDAAASTWPDSVRQTVADLDLTYYLPCRARGRTIAWLGVSRTNEGDFLTSDDVDLLQTLAGYVGIAIENARLYWSLQRKAQEVERLKEFSENIVESISVGILAVGFDERVESWNSQLEQLTGISREAALDKRLTDVLPPELSAQLTNRAYAQGVHHLLKVSFDAAGQESRLLNIAIAPLISKDQEQIGRLMIFDDVTERSALEVRLMQADKLSSIGLLAAGVAHEVNTPLAVISTYAQMLAKQVNGDESKTKLLEKIAKQTFRASSIVNSLLNFSRTGSTDFEDVDLAKVMHETVTLVDPQLRKANVRVLTELPEGQWTIRGNSSKLQQVFLNLILNARDAMEQGGDLHLVCRADGEEGVLAQVRDTGCGIAPEVVQRIYDPFFTTKGIGKGTGLGLSITYGIVKEHNGVIEVDTVPNEGTTFRLRFPLAARPIPATGVAAGPAASAAGAQVASYPAVQLAEANAVAHTSSSAATLEPNRPAASANPVNA